MILSSLLVGFEVTNFEPDDEALGILDERITSKKPKLCFFTKKDINYAVLENRNILVTININLLFEDEVLTKAVRQEMVRTYKSSIIDEFIEYFNSNGVLSNLITVD